MGHLKLTALSLVACLWFGARPAAAIPVLQIYLEGGVYNTATESWEITPAGGSSGGTFRLWAIGNINGPGGAGPIYDVKLSAVYDTSVGDITITLTPTVVGGTGSYNGFTDSSTPIAPTVLVGPLQAPATEGTSPLLGDGKSLPAHGEYGAGRIWQEFGLGHFTTADSPIGDFIGGFPTPSTGNHAQINVYEISVTGNFGVHPFTIHFDLFDTVYAKNHAKSKFAPFSHDGDGDVTIAPEPGSAALASIGLCGVLGIRRVTRRRNGAAAGARGSSA